MPMTWADHPWEKIYRSEGRAFDEPFPGFAPVAQAFKERGCQKVLDLGCGAGRHVLALARLGYEVCGADISFSGLQLTRAWLHEENLDAHTVQADMRFPLPFSDGCFSGVLSTQVIHHARLSEVRLAIAEIYRLLAPGGLAFVTVAGRLDSGEQFEEIEPGTFVPLTGTEQGLSHHIFTKERLAEAFERFDVEEISERAGGKVLAVLAARPQNHD